MNFSKGLLLGFILLLTSVVSSQTATVQGIILDENNTPVSNVAITNSTSGTQSNANGFYQISIPANTLIKLQFSHLSFKNIEVSFQLKNGEIVEFNPVMNLAVEQIATVVVSSSRNKDIEGVTSLDPETIRKIPGANPGVENLLMTLPGVSNNNELSTQYNVRGGNFDENLVYVNGIEIYRPFLIRSGQQEGLSFVNTDMVRSVDKRPYQFEAHADLSLLGAGISIENMSKDSKFTALVGARYRDNRLLINARETETTVSPVFTDVQGLFTYRFTNKFQLSFLGNAALNSYNFIPQTRQTNFGTLADPKALSVYYNGQEKDRYQT